MKDIDLILEIRAKEKQGLDNLINQYGKLIYSVLNSVLDRTQDKEYMDECFDDVLLNIWYNIDCFDEDKGIFKNWIISIAKYKGIDYKRKSNEKYEICQINTLTITSKTNIEEEVVIKEEINELMELIEKLNYMDKLIFIKKYLDEESIEEISKELKLSREYIYNRISRGKKKLRGLKEEKYYE